MIYYKTTDEITLIRKSSLLVSETLAMIAGIIKPGVTTLWLDQQAEAFIRDNGGKPSFKGYKGYQHTLCVSVNDQVVHGIPSAREIKNGDVVSVDCGAFLNGFHGDSAFTFLVGEVSREAVNLARVTRACVYKGIEFAVAGNRVGDVSHAIQLYAEHVNGYGVVRELVGHGIGKNLHEEPEVPNFGAKGKGPKMQEGMVIAIEPMINLGSRNVVQENDGWTIRTRDGKVSCHFEHTVAVMKGKADVLSSFEIIDEAMAKNSNLYTEKEIVG
ncbi:MAG TPA: type I methionyl aminopeptidase [Chitinophagales bacterium]|nr:type I methionyl aminopeptidase [Chitinophagales bacterium]HNJ88189.1 type I methionyl aminopeptidase [Chitinophagales bacterium]